MDRSERYQPPELIQHRVSVTWLSVRTEAAMPEARSHLIRTQRWIGLAWLAVSGAVHLKVKWSVDTVFHFVQPKIENHVPQSSWSRQPPVTCSHSVEVSFQAELKESG